MSYICVLNKVCSGCKRRNCENKEEINDSFFRLGIFYFQWLRSVGNTKHAFQLLRHIFQAGKDIWNMLQFLMFAGTEVLPGTTL